MTDPAAVDEVRARHEEDRGLPLPDGKTPGPEWLFAKWRAAHQDRATLLRAYEEVVGEVEARRRHDAKNVEPYIVRLEARVAALEEGLRQLYEPAKIAVNQIICLEGGETLCQPCENREALAQALSATRQLLTPPAPKEA
jgi:hypothetical protein